MERAREEPVPGAIGKIMKHISILTVMAFCALLSGNVYGVDKKLLDAAGIMEIAEDAPDFTVVSQPGPAISLKGLRGKVVILHMWATWCKPCEKEFPLFEKLYEDMKGRAVVFLPVSIDLRATQEDINGFAKEHRASFPVYLARNGNITDRYWTWGVPVTYFIDKKGRIIGRALGQRRWSSESVYSLINALEKE
jgi:peroxiredoxin